MGNQQETRLLLGSLRYKSAVDVDFSIKVPFVQTVKELTEYDRSVDNEPCKSRCDSSAKITRAMGMLCGTSPQNL